MHFLESYSLNCGAKIDKPYIYENFFPMPIEKFIIFAPNIKNQSKEYAYFQDVLNIIQPILEKENIKILQVGPKNSPSYEKVINLSGQMSNNQMAYLINNSMLVFGNDGLELQIAGAKDIPLLSINSITYSQNTGPYFGNRNIQKIFESYKNIGNKKASFNVNENPKSINSIKPEEIADSIFKLLNINSKTPFETVFLGERYSNNYIQESIPDSKHISFNPETLIEIRADHDYNEEAFIFQLSNYKKAVIVTDKQINLNILKNFKNNIQMLVFKITKENNIEFLEKAKEIGLNIYLISEMSKEEIDAEKIKYYEFGSINMVKGLSEQKINELKKDLDKLYYKSSKITSSNGKFYYGLTSKIKNVIVKDTSEYLKVVDNPEFWKDANFFTIIRIIS